MQRIGRLFDWAIVRLMGVLAAIFGWLLRPRALAFAGKESGIGMSITIDDAAGTGVDISNDVTNATFNTNRGQQDVTGLDKSGMERLLLLNDFNLSITAVFNDAVSSMFTVFSTPADNDTRTVVIVISGQTLTAECLMTDVGWSRNADGSFTASATFVLANGTAAVWS